MQKHIITVVEFKGIEDNRVTCIKATVDRLSRVEVSAQEVIIIATSEEICVGCFSSDRYRIGNTMVIFIIGPRLVKTRLGEFANNTYVDQPAHVRSLITAFVVCLLLSCIC